MHAVSFRATGIGEIDLIRPLREQFDELHHEKAFPIKTHDERMTFKDRTFHFCKPDGY